MNGALNGFEIENVSAYRDDHASIVRMRMRMDGWMDGGADLSQLRCGNRREIEEVSAAFLPSSSSTSSTIDDVCVRERLWADDQSIGETWGVIQGSIRSFALVLHRFLKIRNHESRFLLPFTEKEEL